MNNIYTPVKGKAPFLDDWPNKPMTKDEALATPGTTGYGIIHAHAGTCSIDLDDYEKSIEHFKEVHGIDLEYLLDPSRAYLIKFPKVNRAKALFVIPEQLEYVKRIDGEGKAVYELRAGSIQDVMPGSAYPGGGKYEHSGLTDIPPIPKDLLEAWEKEQVEQQKFRYSYGEAKLSVTNDDRQSVIYLFNITHSIEDVLEEAGYKQEKKAYLSPKSGSGVAGVRIFDSHTHPWQLCYSHHASDGVLANRAVDAFELATHILGNGDKKQYARHQSKLLKAIDPTTGEKLGITVAEYNGRPAHYVPEHLLYPDSPFGGLVKAVEDASQYRKNPVAALVNALGIVAAASGGAFTTADKDSTSCVLVVVGPTKVGKSQTAKGARALFPREALIQRQSRMGGSDEGVQETFAALAGIKPDLWYQIDEIGFLFADMKKGSGGGNRWQTILEIVTLGHDVWSTRALANKPSVLIPVPHLVVSGSTTLEALKGGLDKRDIATGAINRMLIFDVSQEVTVKNKGEHSFDKAAMKRLAELYDVGSNMSMHIREHTPKIIGVEPGVSKAIRKLTEESLDANNSRARHEEQAFNLAMIRAIYEDTNISVELFQWGYALVECSYKYIEHLFNTALGDRESLEVVGERKLLKKLTDNKGRMRKAEALNIREINLMGATRKNAWLAALDEMGTIELVKDGKKAFILLGEE